MKKQIIKKLFTFYTVEDTLDNVKNNPSHIFSSYSGGKAECIQYHDTLTGWLEEIMYILTCEHKNGFGIRLVDENGNRLSNSSHKLTFNTCEYNSKSEDEIIKRMAEMLTYYFNTNSYYEFEDDGIYKDIEYTGHQYYRSPYESYDNCGTCDGARCDYCKKKYVVKNLRTDTEYYNGTDKEKANLVYKEHQKDYSEIINDILEEYSVDKEWYQNETNGDTNIKALFTLLNRYSIPYIYN